MLGMESEYGGPCSHEQTPGCWPREQCDGCKGPKVIGSHLSSAPTGSGR